jgi:hypothetical protein
MPQKRSTLLLRIMKTTYRLRFAESGWSISILGIYIEKYYAVTFYNVKYSASDRDPRRSTFSRFFAFGVFKHVNPVDWVDMLRGGLSRKFEKFYN